MRRRDFIGLIGGAVGWPLAVRAQESKVPRVGYLFSFTEREGRHLWDACRQGLHELGYVEGRNIVLEPRWAEGQHENLAHYRSLLVTTADETVRSQLFKLIAEEERQQILQERDWSSPTEIVMD